MRQTDIFCKNDKRLIIAACSLAASGAIGTYTVAQWTVSLSDRPLMLLIMQFALQTIPHILTYYLTYKLMRKFKYTTLLGISIFVRAMSAVFFLGFALFGQVMLGNIVFGILAGAGSGMFWCSYNVALNRVERHNFKRYLSTEGSLSEILSIGAPFIMAGSILIFRNVYELPVQVYITLVALNVTLKMIAVAFVFTVKGDREKGVLGLKGKFFKRDDKLWNNMILFSLFFGVVSGVAGSLGGVILILFTQSGHSQVAYLVILSVCMFAASMVLFFYRRIRIGNRFLYYFFVTVEAAVFITISFLYGSFVLLSVCGLILLVQNIAVKMRLPLEVACHVEVLSSYLKTEGNVAGRYFVREMFIIIGRLIGAGVALTFALTISAPYYFFVAVLFGFIVFNSLTVIWYTRVLKGAGKLREQKTLDEDKKELFESQPA